MISKTYKINALRHASNRRMSGVVTWVLLMPALLLISCYQTPYEEDVRPVHKSSSASTAVPLAQVYFYPKENQSTERQSRDHYECYNWAVKQSGFDPGRAPMEPEQRVRVVPMPPPGHDTAAYAIAGAVLGALFAGHRHVGEGALFGAAGGAMVGAVSDASRQEHARQVEESYNERDRGKNAKVEAKALEFRRAMSACLEGRGYSVK